MVSADTNRTLEEREGGIPREEKNLAGRRMRGKRRLGGRETGRENMRGGERWGGHDEECME